MLNSQKIKRNYYYLSLNFWLLIFIFNYLLILNSHCCKIIIVIKLFTIIIIISIIFFFSILLKITHDNRLKITIAPKNSRTDGLNFCCLGYKFVSEF